MPFCRLESFGQLAQLLTCGSGFGDGAILRTLAQLRAVGPAQPVLLRVKEIFQAQPTNPPSQLASVAVNRIPQDRSRRHSIGQRFLNQIPSNFRFGLEFHNLGNPSLFPARQIFGPVCGKYSCPPTGAATSPSVTTNST